VLRHHNRLRGDKAGPARDQHRHHPGEEGLSDFPRAVGKYKAMEMILTGAMISAEEAKALGLVNRVVPPGKVPGGGPKLASEIASRPPIAVRSAKQAIAASQERSLSEGLEVGLTLFYELSPPRTRTRA